MRREEEYAMLDGEIMRLKAEVERQNGVVTRQREENDGLHKEVTDANLKNDAWEPVVTAAQIIVDAEYHRASGFSDPLLRSVRDALEAIGSNKAKDTDSRIRVPTQPCICGLSAARCPIHERSER